jgi:hypothetical protein
MTGSSGAKDWASVLVSPVEASLMVGVDVLESLLDTWLGGIAEQKSKKKWATSSTCRPDERTGPRHQLVHFIQRLLISSSLQRASEGHPDDRPIHC